MADTFPSISPSYGSAGDTGFRVLEANFGDGYSQRAADGLNSVGRVWSLTWENRPDADIATIYDFLIDKLGFEAFLWTAPDEAAPRKWICGEDISKTPVATGYATIRCEFEEVFDL